MEHQRKLFQQRGYSEDLLPKTQSQRTWKTFNYFTLWMGSVHNVPNYVMVGGFFILGLSTFSIMLAIILSAFFIAAVMVLNGAAGSKYGVPFAMILRASYGVRGALFPGLLRGGIAAIMWFGLQCYAGSLACLILIGKIWPGFLTLGGDFTLLGLSLPGLITFLLFWLVNVGIGFGGGNDVAARAGQGGAEINGDVANTRFVAVAHVVVIGINPEGVAQVANGLVAKVAATVNLPGGQGDPRLAVANGARGLFVGVAGVGVPGR